MIEQVRDHDLEPIDTDIIEFEEYVEIYGTRYFVVGEYSNHQEEFLNWAILNCDTSEWEDPDFEDEILSLVYDKI